jgi:hypothetical protein
MLRIHANVASEPLFEALLLGFLFAAAAYLTAGSHRGLWWMCIAAGLAALQRYLGVVLLGLAAIVVLRREGTRGLARSLPPILVSTLPIAVWMIFHNLAATGTLFGPRELGEMLPIQNMGLGLTKILWWFIPRWGPLDWLILRPLIPLAVLVILLLALNNARSWKEWWGAISDALVWPGALFGMLYFVLLAFTVVTADHLDLTSDRYYVVLLPIVTALAFITLDRLILARLTWRPAIKSASLVAALILWAVYPVYAVISYLQLAVVRGEPTNYNIANSAQFREMGVVKAAEPILMQDPDALVYSNYINIVWFIFGHPVDVLPFEPQDLPREERLSALRRDYPNWPEAAGYLIWFTPNQYHHIVSPQELSTIADLRLLYEDETGRVYSVGR